MKKKNVCSVIQAYVFLILRSIEEKFNFMTKQNHLFHLVSQRPWSLFQLVN